MGSEKQNTLQIQTLSPIPSISRMQIEEETIVCINLCEDGSLDQHLSWCQGTGATSLASALLCALPMPQCPHLKQVGQTRWSFPL